MVIRQCCGFQAGTALQPRQWAHAACYSARHGCGLCFSSCHQVVCRLPAPSFLWDGQQSRQEVAINLFSPSCLCFGHGIYNGSGNLNLGQCSAVLSHLGSLRSRNCLGQRCEINNTSERRTQLGLSRILSKLREIKTKVG